PQVAITVISDVHLMAGRRYRLHWRDTLGLGSLHASHFPRMICQLSRDGGGSWTNVARAYNLRAGATGVWNFLVDSSASYKPASDEDARFRVQVIPAAGTTAYNVTFSSNDSDAVAFLEVEDQGGEF